MVHYSFPLAKDIVSAGYLWRKKPIMDGLNLDITGY